MHTPAESITMHINDKYNFTLKESDITELVLFFLHHPYPDCWLYDKNSKSTFRVTREEIITPLLQTTP